MQTFLPGEPMYEEAATAFHQFLRRTAADHYTTRTMNQVFQQARDGELPLVMYEFAEPSFDPLTEVKRGGVRAGLAVLRDNRVLLATHPEFRRQGIGASLYHGLLNTTLGQSRPLLYWVHATNTDAVRFLVAQGATLRATSAETVAQCWAPITSGGLDWAL